MKEFHRFFLQHETGWQSCSKIARTECSRAQGNRSVTPGSFQGLIQNLNIDMPLRTGDDDSFAILGNGSRTSTGGNLHRLDGCRIGMTQAKVDLPDRIARGNVNLDGNTIIIHIRLNGVRQVAKCGRRVGHGNRFALLQPCARGSLGDPKNVLILRPSHSRRGRLGDMCV